MMMVMMKMLVVMLMMVMMMLALVLMMVMLLVVMNDVDGDGDGDDGGDGGDDDDDDDVALRSLCFAFPGLQLTIVSQKNGAIPVLHVHRGACSCASSWCAWTLGKNGRAAVNHIHLSKTAFKNEPKHAFKNEPKHAFKNDHLPVYVLLFVLTKFAKLGPTSIDTCETSARDTFYV